MSRTSTLVPRRVLLVLQSTAIGGMETHCIDLAAEFVRRGIAVQVVLPENTHLDPLVQRFECAGAPVLRLSTDARHGRPAQVTRALRFLRLLRTFRPAAVHLHTGGATGGAGVLALTRLGSRASAIITEHNVLEAGASFRRRAACRLTGLLADGVVAVSRENAAVRVARSSRPRNFYAVLNGVPIPELGEDEQRCNRAVARDELGIAAETVVAGSLVRLAADKGIDTLLRAFALVTNPNAHLLLVGDGPIRGDLERLAAELEIAPRVTFAGHREPPGPYLDAMDVFCLPVPRGSMSIGLLEAMARGLPPIITFGGIEEAVIDGYNGLRPPPDDHLALHDALSRLIDDPSLRDRFGRAARAHVAANYSVGRVADDLLDIYAARRSGRPARLDASAPAISRQPEAVPDPPPVPGGIS